MTETPSAISPGISIVIPAFNEEKVIDGTLSAIKEALREMKDYEIIVIDDGSADNTGTIAEQAGAKVIRNERTFGYGKALITGLKQAKGRIIVTFDADQCYDPMDIHKLVKQSENYDLVIGSRFLEPSRKSERIPLFKVFASKLLALMMYFLTRVRLTDVQSGFKAIRHDALDQIHLTLNGHSISYEIVNEAARKGFKIYEVPVLYRKWQRM